MARGTYFLGFDHLIGETVAILADGLKHDPVVVDSDGAITITRDASEIVAGFANTPILATMNLEAGGEDGEAAQGDVRRFDEVTKLSLHKCLIYLAFTKDSAEFNNKQINNKFKR